MSMPKEIIELIIGAIFIIVYSYDRYNKPSTNRLSTTAFRYHLSAFIYAAIYLIFYYIFTKYPSFLKIFQVGEIGGTPGLLDTLKELPPALLVALILTIFVDKISFVKTLDIRLREFLQKSAEIPFEALRLASQLRNSALHFDGDNILTLTTNKLIEEGFSEDDIVISETAASDIKGLLTRLTAVTLRLELWEKDRDYIRFIQEHRETYSSLFNRYNRLLKKAKICFELNDEEFASLDSPKVMIASRECKNNFKEQCRALYAAECDFISQAVLSSNVTENARTKALSDIGFQLNTTSTTSGLSVNQITTLMVFLFAIVATVLIFGSQYIEDPKKNMLIGLMVGIIYTVSTACVTYTKSKWKIAARDAEGNRPTLYYLLVGLLAVVMSIPVSVIFKTFFDIYASSQASIGELFTYAAGNIIDEKWPYKIIIFISAFSLAYLIDNNPWQKVSIRQWQLIEGSINAVIICAASVFAIWLMKPEIVNLDNGKFLLSIFRNSMIGFLIGYLVPHWYRNASISRNSQIEDSADFITRTSTGNENKTTVIDNNTATSNPTALATSQ